MTFENTHIETGQIHVNTFPRRFAFSGVNDNAGYLALLLTRLGVYGERYGGNHILKCLLTN
jgi:hypothetical protein